MSVFGPNTTAKSDVDREPAALVEHRLRLFEKVLLASRVAQRPPVPNHKFNLYAASSRFAIPSKGEPWPIPFVPNAAICAEADHPPIALSSSDMILASFDTNRSRKRLIVLLSPFPDDRSSHPRQTVQPLRLSAWRSIQSEARRTEMRGNGGSVPSLRELLPLQG
ncbi:hypothetical protein [Mesorhizobium qingshengii]|uniref:hypothetical protein n=1 Tax=Mesorhizobium qingshengii TaxID=1165689 RepID=UPI0014289845|nr:hypothetical protein [Mesorhizobium qingshengii]